MIHKSRGAVPLKTWGRNNHSCTYAGFSKTFQLPFPNCLGHLLWKKIYVENKMSSSYTISSKLIGPRSLNEFYEEIAVLCRSKLEVALKEHK